MRDRARGRWRRVGAALTVALGFSAGAGAQVVPPPDTLATDTLPAPDSIAVNTVADSVRALPQLVGFGAPADLVPAESWEWDHTALLESGAFDIGDLLDRIPGFVRVRTGVFGAGQAGSLTGLGAGRLEFVVDGFVIDPLDAAILDFSRFEIGSLSSVQVQRFPDVLRVTVQTHSPLGPGAYSRVEAGTGDFDLELFRGVFLTPSFLGGQFGAAVDRLAIDQFLPGAQVTALNGWLKWRRVMADGRRGVEVELRRSSMERDLEMPAPMEGRRNDFIVRARSALGTGGVAEIFYGLSSQEDEYPDSLALPADSLEVPRFRRDSDQAGARVQYSNPRIYLSANGRWRNDERLPAISGAVEGAARIAGPLRVSAHAGMESWKDAASGIAYGVRADVPLFDGAIAPFAEWGSGERGTPGIPDSVGMPPRMTDRTSMRAGVRVSRWGADVTAAANALEADSIASFGLEFDSPMTFYPAGELTGFEVSARVPLFTQKIAAEGWFNTWAGDNPWIYFPEVGWRAGLAYHDTPMRDNPNLEVLARVEATRRGTMRVPAERPVLFDTENPELGFPKLGFTDVPGRTEMNFYLQVRVVDVRVFLRWENLTNRIETFDVPGRELPGQRVFFGVKWEFRN